MYLHVCKHMLKTKEIVKPFMRFPQQNTSVCLCVYIYRVCVCVCVLCYAILCLQVSFQNVSVYVCVFFPNIFVSMHACVCEYDFTLLTTHIIASILYTKHAFVGFANYKILPKNQMFVCIHAQEK